MTELKRCHACGQWPSITKKQYQQLVVQYHDRNGYGWSAIAEKFNTMGLPTLSGGQSWYPSTVLALYRSATGDRLVRQAATASHCVRRNVGAAIYDSYDRLLSIGWNEPEDPHLVCKTDCPRASSTVAPYSDYREGAGRCIAIHAEDMALRNTSPGERKDGVMYVTDVPCDDCEKLLEASGLGRWVVLK